MKNIRTPTVVGLIKAENTLPAISSADAGKLATVDSNGKWAAANLTVGQGEVAVDSTLLVTGAAADAKVTGDKLGELKSAVTNLDGYFVLGINMFNPDDSDIVDNVELKTDGTTASKTGYFASGYYPIIPGGTVCINYPTGTYGSASAIVFYNTEKQRSGYAVSVSRLTDSRGYGYIKYTFPDSYSGYFRVTGYMAYKPVYMYVYASEMPSTYSPYTDKITLSDEVVVPFDSVKNVAVSKADTDFIKPIPVNLVDLSKCESGIIKSLSTDGGIDANDSWVTTDYISVEPGETYALCIFPGVYYGAGFKGIPCYSEEKTQVARVTQAGGSVATIAARVTITIPNNSTIKYIRTSYYKSYAENPKLMWECQIFKASAWPTDMYVPYDGSDKLIGAGLENAESVKYNPLFGKSAMWNGDSICAADNDPLGGWPGRIAVANGMMFKNYGISGGTIAENTGTSVHSVSSTLNGMLTDFPNADYIIIEGGTNDADILGSEGIGTYDPDDFTSEYIEALNADTFSGALESIFYRLVTTMKTKHIGYLIPQKMGHTEILVERRRVYFDRAIDICKKWGIPYLDLWDDFYFNWRLAAHWDQTKTTTENETAGNLYVDGQHLTTTGYSIESPIIAEWMRTF